VFRWLIRGIPFNSSINLKGEPYKYRHYV